MRSIFAFTWLVTISTTAVAQPPATSGRSELLTPPLQISPQIEEDIIPPVPVDTHSPVIQHVHPPLPPQQLPQPVPYTQNTFSQGQPETGEYREYGRALYGYQYIHPPNRRSSIYYSARWYVPTFNYGVNPVGAEGIFVGPSTAGWRHMRYPYYSYRRPWYTPGRPSINIDIVW